MSTLDIRLAYGEILHAFAAARVRGMLRVLEASDGDYLNFNAGQAGEPDPLAPAVDASTKKEG